MLRIKSENGEQAFLLMMRPEDTVGDVRTLLAQARWARGRAGTYRGSPAPGPGLMHSARSPGPRTPPPSRSSVRSHPRSTTTTQSHCRPQAWCPMQRCCFGRAGPHRLLQDPAPPPNKRPLPHRLLCEALLAGQPSPAPRKARGPAGPGRGRCRPAPSVTRAPAGGPGRWVFVL